MIIAVVPGSMCFSQVPTAPTCKAIGSNLSAGAGIGLKSEACAA